MNFQKKLLVRITIFEVYRYIIVDNCNVCILAGDDVAAFSQAEVEEDIPPDAGQIDSDEELDIDVLTEIHEENVSEEEEDNEDERAAPLPAGGLLTPSGLLWQHQTAQVHLWWQNGTSQHFPHSSC